MWCLTTIKKINSDAQIKKRIERARRMNRVRKLKLDDRRTRPTSGPNTD